VGISLSDPIYHRFLGRWVLDAASCIYEQGEPPKAGSYHIEKKGEELVFHMNWIGADGEAHDMSFCGKPDGVPVPFDGGPLADALCITAKSERELNSTACRDGIELMVATRTLSDDGVAMEIVQTVNLPDGTSSSNRSTYHREQ
jgi:hypothetical protein